MNAKTVLTVTMVRMVRVTGGAPSRSSPERTPSMCRSGHTAQPRKWGKDALSSSSRRQTTPVQTHQRMASSWFVADDAQTVGDLVRLFLAVARQQDDAERAHIGAQEVRVGHVVCAPPACSVAPWRLVVVTMAAPAVASA
jgi:hypothetical protein